MELKRQTEKPNSNLPMIKFLKLKKFVIMLPTIPKKQAIMTAFRLPIFISCPPLTAPIVIPNTTDVPIQAYFLVAKSSSWYHPNLAFNKLVT